MKSKRTNLLAILAAAFLTGAAAPAAEGPAAEMGALEETYAFLKDCGAFFVATDDGGQPRVRPFGALAMWEGRLYLQTGNFKNVFRQMSENPRVEICALKGDRSAWIRVTAEVVVDARREAREAVLDANPELKGMYSADDGRCEVLWLKGAKATIESFGAEKRELQF